MNNDAIAILDFGSQYTQLIARRVREARVYCELFPWDTPPEEVLALRPRGFILSGGPASVYDPGSPRLPGYVLEQGTPVLGICYGMQLLARRLGGQVASTAKREYGPAVIEFIGPDNPLFANLQIPNPQSPHLKVWMSHGDRIEAPPPGFSVLARSANSPLAAMGDLTRQLYGLQFHPEVVHTERGGEIVRRFAIEICGCAPDWTPAAFVEQATDAIRDQVGSGRVVCGVSGGVDSAVTATLTHRAVGDQLTCIFVNPGLLRRGEPEQVVRAFRGRGMRLVPVDATEEFLAALSGVTDPEQKRRIIGERFIRVFEREAGKLEDARFLAQGTLYPDVIESRGPERQAAARIKTHHNVGGLPEDMAFELIEPLRYLFKDEARAVGKTLGLPEEIVWRQPFPGPGLAVRILGQVTWERLETLRAADGIFLDELRAAGLLREATQQSFAVLLPVQSVGVMGDERTYQNVIALRAVTTEDFMTADWARLDHELLARISNRIVNEVTGVNRVVYDVTSKPPATIEWE
ncbi:MAG: GMP synthase (glutamine-hydrolyzing) [Chloroflexi bacterium]|nr:MAG: GMP synthase (glutamine-hydrolyzing) [Chloroflexota bacterium]